MREGDAHAHCDRRQYHNLGVLRPARPAYKVRACIYLYVCVYIRACVPVPVAPRWPVRVRASAGSFTTPTLPHPGPRVLSSAVASGSPVRGLGPSGARTTKTSR